MTVTAACAGLIIAAAMMYVASLDVAAFAKPMTQPTQILDRNGEKIYTLSVRKSEPVPISAMPESLIQAIIAVEDRRFYEHPGVDILSIARALYRDLRAGNIVEGGSTITQQLAKNAFLSPDKSFERKLREAAYALKIDMTYDKQEIMERYLNTIYFGEGAWGVQAASRTYFGKDVGELTLDEAALLAGLPKAPSRYSPVKNPEGALQRRNLVLTLMAEQGMIDENTLKDSSAKAIVLRPHEESENQGRYASYVDAVIQEAIDVYGMSENQLMSGGWVIKTEMDGTVQDAAVEVYADPAQFPDSANGQLVQSGSVFLDQRTGGIRAIVGYRGEGTYRAFNRATQLRRQPGSSFKPIAAYGPALEQGYTPLSKLYDGPIDVNGYRPRNWDRRYHGEVSMFEAVRQSWNIPAVWLLDRIGIEKGMEFAERLDIPLTPQDRNLGLALGGLSKGVSPLHMAHAFSAFANNGLLYTAHTIGSVESQDGEIIAKFDEKPRQAIHPHIAYTMTILLQNAVENGTGRNAAIPGRPTAGKTGTTELPETGEFEGIRGAKDLWFVGYTPELTGAVWIGYDQTDREHYLTTSSAAAASVFREIMSRALADAPRSSFDVPEGFKADWRDRGDDDKDKKGKDKDKEKDNDDRKERGKEKGNERKKEDEKRGRDKRDNDRGKDRDKEDEWDEWDD
ncbi:transglycosylase domain-containing protein [Paenibacillus alkalitolerans]|uniref:transglycosylase domain-containing protein n=1 Tax=Paenibacillus alkalitolerans TaxID=2799335 RepID=UPI0018F54A4D|nr:PBP1A family penicillin-binding protein [Paenibacillus alkalitolerans]